jgi:predicted ATPase
MELEKFQEKVQQYRRPTGNSQKELAQKLGIQPTVLSHKLGGTDKKHLTHQEVKGIVRTLAEWGGITQQSQATELLELMDLKPNSFSLEEWSSPPLNNLTSDLPQHLLPKAIIDSSHNLAMSSIRFATTNHNLPATLTPLIGREREAQTLISLLKSESVRLITLTGPGGVGKTRLSLKIAHALIPYFPDGVWFVALANASDNSQVISEIARVFHLGGQERLPILQSLKNFLVDKHLLLVLDNFEQVLKAAPLVAELLTTAAKLKVIVSSRAVLHIYGEYEFVVPTLALPNTEHLPTIEHLNQYEAVRLFVERARSVKANFNITPQNAIYVAQICARLDGLPLAIELAAVRSKIFSPQAMLEQLLGENGLGLKFLAGEAPNLPPRHRALHKTLEWSYHLLSNIERQLFAHLSVFNGSFNLAAAQAICCSNSVEELASLVDKSMVQQAEDNSGEIRFSLLETVHEFALEQLEVSPEKLIIKERHLAYYLNFAQEADAQIKSIDQEIWANRLELEYNNLRTALEWCSKATQKAVIERGLELASSLRRFWFLRGYIQEGYQWLSSLMAHTNTLPEGVEPTLRIKALNTLSFLASQQGENKEAMLLCNQSVALARQIGYEVGLASALGTLAIIAYNLANFSEALKYGEECLAIRRKLEDKAGIADVLNTLALVARQTNNYKLAQDLYAEALSLFEALGDQHSISITLNGLGELERVQNRHESSHSYHLQALELRRKLGNKQGIVASLNNLANLEHAKGHFEEAKGHFEEALALGKVLGQKKVVAILLSNLGSVELEMSHYESALAYTEEALQLSRLIGDKRQEAISIHNLSEILLYQGKLEQARQLAEQALALKAELGDQQSLAISQGNMAEILLQQGEVAAARLLLETSLSIFQNFNNTTGIIKILPGLATSEKLRGNTMQALGLLYLATNLMQAKGIAQNEKEKSRLAQAIKELQDQLGPEKTEAARLDSPKLEIQTLISNSDGSRG